MKVTLNLRLLHKYKMTLSDKDILKGMCRFRALYDENCKQTADLPTSRQYHFVCSYGRILAHQGAINQCLILEQGIKGIENMALMVVPAKGVVLRSRHGKADDLFSSK